MTSKSRFQGLRKSRAGLAAALLVAIASLRCATAETPLKEGEDGDPSPAGRGGAASGGAAGHGGAAPGGAAGMPSSAGKSSIAGGGHGGVSGSGSGGGGASGRGGGGAGGGSAGKANGGSGGSGQCASCDAPAACLCCGGTCYCTVTCASDDDCSDAAGIDASYDHCGNASPDNICAPDGACG